MLELLRYDFVQRAFLIALLIAPLFGLLSTVIVSSKLAYFSDALGHSSVLGACLGGLIFGASNPLAILAFAIIFASLIYLFKRKTKTDADSIIGIVSSGAISIALIIMAASSGFANFQNILIGDILSTSTIDIYISASLLIIGILLWCFIYNKLVLISLGLSRRFWAEFIFMVFLSIVISFAISWVGMLMINALLIIPASAGRLISKNLKHWTLLSILFATLSCCLGILLALVFDFAPSPMICLVGIAIYTVCLVFRRK